MENLQELARTYRRILQLKTGPVAIRILKTHEEVPVLLKKPPKLQLLFTPIRIMAALLLS